ncbi:MAG: AAA family ATPase [Thermodesulfobacteriota bacterium]
MNNIVFDEDGYPRIYTIHSQKGGVGKTSIALALAGMAGAKGKKTLIIDGDMTGASIADVPGMECERGSNFNKLILANPNEFLQLTELGPLPKGDKRTNLEMQFCRKKIDHESVYFIPSSASPADVERVVPLIAQEDHLHFFRHRIEDTLAAAIRSGFQMIILDHSPGLFGFSKTALQMSLEWGLPQDKNNHRLRYLLNGKMAKPSLRALLVSSFEPHDYRAVLVSLGHVMEMLISTHQIEKDKYLGVFADSFRFVFNKASSVSDSIEEVGKLLRKMDGLAPWLAQMIHDHEKEFGPQLSPLIDGFDMGDICSKAKAFFPKDKPATQDRRSGDWERWLRTIAYRARLIKE